MPTMTLPDFVSVLESEPTQECVVMEEVYENFDFSPEEASLASGRPFKTAIEHHKMKDTPGIALRATVWVFGPKKETA